MKAITSSMGFAAYLRLLGYEMIEQSTNGPKKFYFYFDIDRVEMDRLYKEFTQSKYFEYDSIMKKIRKDVALVKTINNNGVTNADYYCK